jgi:hydroxypyruvate reductase
MGTDGVDGPTDAAGAIADTQTLNRARKLRMDAVRLLDTHNSYNFFKKLGDLIITGPTGTNVNDIMILAVPKDNLTRRSKSAEAL